MVDKIGFFDDTLEQIEKVSSQTTQQIKKAPTNLAKTAANQIAPGGLMTQDPSENSPDNQNQAPKPLNSPAKNLSQLLRQQIAPKKEDKIKEQQELQKVRQELHQKYYQNLINRPKLQEEAPAERVERQEKEEDQKKFLEEKKKEENKMPVNMRQGTGEKQTGIGG